MDGDSIMLWAGIGIMERTDVQFIGLSNEGCDAQTFNRTVEIRDHATRVEEISHNTPQNIPSLQGLSI